MPLLAGRRAAGHRPTGPAAGSRSAAAGERQEPIKGLWKGNEQSKEERKRQASPYKRGEGSEMRGAAAGGGRAVQWTQWQLHWLHWLPATVNCEL